MPTPSPLAPPDASPAGASRLRPWILLAGVFAWAGLLFHASPIFGGHETRWPWRVWIDSNVWFVRADLFLWAACGTLAIAVGLGFQARSTPRVRRILGLLTVLACFLEIRVHAQAGAFPLFAEESRLDVLKLFLPLAGLGTGLFVLASRDARARPTAVGLVVLSALALVTVQITTFPKGIGGQSLASRTVTKGIELWREVVQRGEILEEVRTQFLRLLLGRVAPFLSLVVAVILGLVAAWLSRRGPTRAARVTAGVALGFIVLRWVVPVVLQFVLDTQAIRTVGRTRVFAILADALISAGLTAWLLTSVAGSAWLRAAHESTTNVPGTFVVDSRRRGWATLFYVIALPLAVFALFAALNPMWGTFAKAWPWDVARDLVWSQPLSTLVFLTLFVAALAVSIGSRPGPARGFVVATVAVLALLTTGGPNPTVERPEEFLYGVAPLLPPLLAAICAGGILATRAGGPGAARASALAVGAGACLLAILLYPLRVDPKRVGGGMEYRSILQVAAAWPESVRDFFVGIEPSFGNPFVVFAHAGLALLGLSAAFGSVGRVRRALAAVGLATVFFWTALAHRVLLAQPFESGQPSPWDQIKAQGDNPWNAVLEHAGGYLLAFCVPFGVALVGAMLDLAAPAPHPEPQAIARPKPGPAPAS